VVGVGGRRRRLTAAVRVAAGRPDGWPSVPGSRRDCPKVGDGGWSGTPQRGIVGANAERPRAAHEPEDPMADSMGEKIKGVAKESMGKVTGDDDQVREGEAQQRKAQKSDEADRAQAEADRKTQEAAGHEGEQRKRQM
jgi:uncharacterized protein YjbJ (UPF0337 family)